MTPEWNAKLPQMPVDANGNWISYPGYNKAGWEAVHQPFYAIMEVDHMETGRSSKIVVLKDTKTGKTYPMFIGDLVKGLKNGDFDVQGGSENSPGLITAWWTGSKRGANYGIKAVRAS